MNLKLVTFAAVALSMTATPVLAASNPAAPLSVASSVRTGSSGKHSNKALGGGVLVGLVIAAGVIAIPVVAAVDNGNNHDRSDSN